MIQLGHFSAPSVLARFEVGEAERLAVAWLAANAIAPTMATRIKIEVASNANA
jgi:hypothetical protein